MGHTCSYITGLEEGVCFDKCVYCYTSVVVMFEFQLEYRLYTIATNWAVVASIILRQLQKGLIFPVACSALHD